LTDRGSPAGGPGLDAHTEPRAATGRARAPIRVLHVQKVAGIGGSENHLLSLLPALSKRGVDVRMCALTAEAGDRFVSRLEHAGVSTSVIAAGPDGNPWAVARLAHLVRRFRPDIVHTHLIHGDAYGQPVARAIGVPAVSSVHGTPAFYRRPWLRKTGQVLSRLADWRVAISEHVRRFLLELELAKPDRIRVIPYGIDPVPWRDAARRRSVERCRLSLESDEIVVGIVARVIEGKGHQALVDAVRIARADVPALRLLVAGAGPALPRVRASVPSDERQAIRFLGFVDDVAGFMSACDVVACPTEPELGEGFGLSALEAMAMGRPVVATRVGSLPEVVLDGESGLLVEPHATADLAAALVRLASEHRLRECLGKGAARRAAEQFSLDGMVTATLGLYDDAIHG
jgi:glycosyltransferase involved in cell wall biosynthesis